MYTPVIFEHPHYGTLLVANMIDIDNEMTDDIELAIWVVCPLPNGDWLPVCASQGTLMQVKTLQ
jgi:hypothetical protein